MKCTKCGQEMKKSGPYADNKDESQPTSKGPDEINYWCINPECSEYQKNVLVVE